MKRISLDVTEGTYQQFAHKCIDEGKSHVEALRELLDEWLKEREARD